MDESVFKDAYDIAIVGAGINGSGIARDAAGRGLKVLICDQSDLGSATSSSSTKLIHGGLRYLEHYEFRLVRESLSEREVLWRMAPHIISPMRFILPHSAAMRPAWLIRLGLFLYDHIGSRQALPKSRGVRFGAESPLQDEFKRGFEYSDCWVDDARLVVLNAMDAHRKGAKVMPRTRCLHAKPEGDYWRLSLQSIGSGEHPDQDDDGHCDVVHAKVLVNATGPWVSSFLSSAVDDTAGVSRPLAIRMVQGSHIIVPKLFDHDEAYLLQNDDGRVVFAIPYEHDFSLIGTTDQDYSGDPSDVKISEAETSYLLGVIKRYFGKRYEPQDIVWSYSGVRPLYDEEGGRAQDASRDYLLKYEAPDNTPPVLSVYGGKLTTYRRLAEAAMSELRAAFPDLEAPWTSASHLPGGDFDIDGVDRIAASLQAQLPFMQHSQARRLAQAYGTMVGDMFSNCTTAADVGEDFSNGLTEVEVRHLVDNEWARTSDDILWRRSKLGLRFTAGQTERLSAWLANYVSSGRVEPSTL